MRRLLGLAAAAGLMFGATLPTARAETVTFSGIAADTTGTGFGNVKSLMDSQSTPSEFGSVIWDGTQDVLNDEAGGSAAGPPKSQTWRVGDLGFAATSTLGLVFNVNESGNPKNLVLDDFVVYFFKPDGSLLFSAPFDASAAATAFPAFADGSKIRLPNVESGTGTAGWLFNINLSGTDANDFFGNPDNRIGMRIPKATPITESDNGPDNWYVAELTGEPPPPLALPAPSVLAGLLSMGALGLVAVARRRRKPK